MLDIELKYVKWIVCNFQLFSHIMILQWSGSINIEKIKQNKYSDSATCPSLKFSYYQYLVMTDIIIDTNEYWWRNVDEEANTYILQYTKTCYCLRPFFCRYTSKFDISMEYGYICLKTLVFYNHMVEYLVISLVSLDFTRSISVLLLVTFVQVRNNEILLMKHHFVILFNKS